MTTTDITASKTYNPFDTPATKTSAASALAQANKAIATKDMFLKLLVAQLSHQNPLNPSDGTQFVSQLAQFTSLEQSTQMSEDLTAIRAALTQVAPASGTNNTGSTGAAT